MVKLNLKKNKFLLKLLYIEKSLYNNFFKPKLNYYKKKKYNKLV